MTQPAPRRIFALYALIALLSVGFYLFVSRVTHGFGFPLDDAWIHQTYARNWVERGEWAFLPGEPSAGSTSPLWTAVIALGRQLHVPPLAWTYLIGALMLLLAGWVSYRWIVVRNPKGLPWPVLAGALVIFEWHLVWSGLSGMETTLSALIAVLLFWMLESGGRWRLGAGLLVGLGLWVRPDAALLAVPVGWHLLWDGHRQGRRSILWGAVLLAAGAGVAVVPYLALNQGLSGAVWPNTFYAKTAEYAALSRISLPIRVLAQLGIPASWFGEVGLESGGPLVGPLMVMLPGIALSIVRSLRQHDYAALAPSLWMAAHLITYALRLPATYQHGRYAVPVLPAMVVLGSEGLLHWIKPGSRQMMRRVASRGWLAALAAITAIFWAAGARAYGRDVAIIESEMVEAAKWIKTNTEPDALVAAHDIGALGYFGERRLLDLAGLVSPEVIEFIRDERALGQFLDARGADYLMTFPGWYPELTRNRIPIYTTSGAHSPDAGGENMAVYRWQSPRFAP